MRVSERQPYQIKEHTWCLNFPPRCSKYTVKFRTVYKTQSLVKHRPVQECCAGYEPDESGDRCVPVCAAPCVHGKCVAPHTCTCDHGYGGPACNICEYHYTVFNRFLPVFKEFFYNRQSIWLDINKFNTRL